MFQAKGDNQKIKSQGEKEGRNAMIISKVKCTGKWNCFLLSAENIKFAVQPEKMAWKGLYPHLMSFQEIDIS